MKIYTKMGDKGKTSLVGGDRVSKANERLQTYGTVDELNATVGIALAVVPQNQLTSEPWILLEQIQHQLFNLGSRLACADEKKSLELPAINEELITGMEKSIDLMEGKLKPLHQFILPGGSLLSAHLHFSRTVCRRAERVLVHFIEKEGRSTDAIEVQFLNRLSDFLFVAARYANSQAHVADVFWRKD